MRQHEQVLELRWLKLLVCGLQHLQVGPGFPDMRDVFSEVL